MNPQIYKTTESAELITKLRVTGVDSKWVIIPYQRAVVLSIKLTDIKAGDIADIRAYGQVSNPNKFYVNPYGVVTSAIMFCYGLVLTNNFSSVDGEEIVEFRGKNITSERNHEPWDCGDYYTFTKDYAEVYVNAVIYAASTAIKPDSTPTYLTVNADYGRLTSALWRS